MLVESADAESTNMGGQLCASTYTLRYLRMYRNSAPSGVYFPLFYATHMTDGLLQEIFFPKLNVTLGYEGETKV